MLKEFAQMNLAQLIPTAYGRPIETESERLKAVKTKFEWTMRLLKLSMLYWEGPEPGARKGLGYYLKTFRAFFILSLSIYYTFFVLSRIYQNWNKESNIMGIVVYTWNVQVAFSMGFLIYWHYTGYIEEVFKSLHMPSNSKIYESVRRMILRSIIFSLTAFGSFVILFTICIILYFVYPEIAKIETLDMEVFNMFHHPYLFPISVAFVMFGFLVWNIVLTFYVIISIVINAELNKFNEELLQIGRYDNNPEVISEELLQKFCKNIEYGRMIRIIDNTFEVYTFVMIGTNIPTTIFSLLTFFKALHGEWLDFILIVPGIFFCLVQLVGLTAVPAKLHEAIGRVESIIYSNTNIWYPYDERIYQIAFALVTHVRQANLGISLWGFTIVSKPLILTTISLTATYLTLMLQLSPTIARHPSLVNTTLH